MRTRLIAVAVGVALAMAMGVSQMAFAQAPPYQFPVLPRVDDNGVPAISDLVPGIETSELYELNYPEPINWIYGPRDDDATTAGGTVPGTPLSTNVGAVKRAMLAGQRVVGHTVNTNIGGAAYCALESEYPFTDFMWTDLRFSPVTMGNAWVMWGTSCSTRQARNGAALAYIAEQETQHAADGGAMVVILPRVNTVAMARQGVRWLMFPPTVTGVHIDASWAPTTRRSSGNTNTGSTGNTGIGRNWNFNVVIIASIETPTGVSNASSIAAVQGIDALYVDADNLSSSSGSQVGDPVFEGLVAQIATAAISNNKRLCGPISFDGRPGFTCFKD